MESNNNISSPEEVLEYIDNHNNKANLMIDEGHDIIEQIKKMNQEISSEIKTQNVIIDNKTIAVCGGAYSVDKYFRIFEAMRLNPWLWTNEDINFMYGVLSNKIEKTKEVK